MQNRTILKAFIYVLLFIFAVELHAQNTLVASDLVNHSFKNQDKSTAISLDNPKHDLKESEVINYLSYNRSNSSNSKFNFLPAIVANGPTTFCAGQSVEISINNTNKRYASNVIVVSSEYQDCGKIDYSSCQALGEPNTFPSYGDFATAWSPFLQDNEREFIELGFDQSTATPINFIDIYETYGAGSVDGVFVKNPNTGLFEQIYTATAAPYGNNARILHISFPTTAFNVSEIRIEMNSGAVADYNEIDAVSIGVEGGTYLWSNGETTPSITVNQSGKYFVTVTDDNGNAETSAEIEVIVKALPTAAISGNPIICSGSEAEIAISITGENTGLWSGSLSDGTTFESASSPIIVKVKPTESTTYTIASLSGGFCEVSDLSGIATITVNQIPIAEISGSAEICKGAETALIISITGDGTGPWSGTITGGIPFSSDQQTISIPVIPTSNTSYSITSFKGEYCTSTNFSGTAEIILLDRPTAVLSGGGNMCAGSSKELSIAVTGVSPWTGQLSDGTIFEGIQSPILVSVNPESTTSYTIISLIGSVCEAKEIDLTGEAVVTVQEIPSAIIAGDADICSGLETDLTITITGEGTGPWVGKISGGTDIIEFNEAVSSFTVKVKPAYSTVYYIESFSGKYCESNDFSGIATVNILERPAAVISGDAIICKGTETQLTIDIIGEGSVFWTGTYFDGISSTPFSSDVTSFNINVNPNISTTYTINNLEGDFCTALDLTGTAVVTVNEIPAASISGSASICAGSETDLNINIIGEGTGPWTGTLSDGLNTIIFSSEVSSFKIKVKPEITTTYTIATLAGGFCEAVDLTGAAIITVIEKITNTTTVSACGEYKWEIDGKSYTQSGKYTFTNDIDCRTDILNLTINALPTVDPISGGTDVCIGSVIQLGNATSNGIWSSASPLVASISETGEVTGLTSGTTMIYYEVTNENGCVTIVSTTIIVNPLPIVTPISGTNSVCVGLTTALSNSTPSGIWKSDSPEIAIVGASGIVIGISAGTAVISYTVTINGCSATSTITVTVNALPIVADITGIQNICVGSISTFANTTSGGTWSSENTAIASVSINGLVTGVAAGTTNIRYAVTLSGCTTTVIRSITVNAVPSIPTSITITSVSDICGNRVYRYAAPALTGTATGYQWSFVGTLGNNASLDSGTLNSQVIRMKFTSNAAAAAGDSARVQFTSVGCNSLNRAIRLTNTLLAVPTAPASITITTVSDVCGNRVYRYTAPALTGTATGYLWSFVGTLGLNAVVDSGTLSSRIVRIKYTLNTASAIGDSARVAYTSGCGNSLNRALRLTNTVLAVPTAPASITITTVSDVCGNRVYRYTAPALTGSAIGYLWSFVGTLGLNAVVDSGTLSSRIVRMKYTLNTAAARGDSARVAYTSACGNSLNRALRLTNTAAVLPTAPASITITTVSDICGNRVYRYTAPALTGTATGYLWSFVGTLGLNAVVDSGTLSSRIVRMKFTLNTAAANGDSARVAYTSACGNSLNRALGLTNTAAVLPTAPASITITTVSDVCGNRVYRYTAPALTGIATEYLWSFVGTLGLNAVVDSGTLSSRIVRMKFTLNTAAANGDSARVAFTSACGNSLNRALRLTNTAVAVPTAPASITIATVSDVCGNRVYRYTAPALTGIATGYLWSFVGTLGLNAVIDSGSLNSRIVRMKYTSNTAAGIGDSARVAYTSACENSLNMALRLTNSAVVVPTTPASITITTVTDVCGNRVYRYTAPALTGTATGYQWSFVGPLGTSAVVDSGSLNSRIVRMKYTSNIAANRRMDSVRVAYTSTCGNSINRALRLSNTALNNCPIAILPSLDLNTSKNDLSISKIEYKSLDVKLFPNPSTGAFYLKVNSVSAESIQVRIIDLSGRVVKSIKTNSSETSMIGSDLREGIYFFEVKQGSETRIVKAVKY